MNLFSYGIIILLLTNLCLLKGVEVTGEIDNLNSEVIHESITVEKKINHHILGLTETPTFTPTRAPTRIPTRVPSRKPTAKPTLKATAHIYGSAATVMMTEQEQQIMCGVITILIFIFMALEILSPEVLFLIALVILILTQVLTLTEALSGNY